MKSFVMLGKRWLLNHVTRLGPEDDHDGECDDPTEKGKTVRVRASLRGKRRLEIYLHEIGGHAADWSKDEAHVTEWASDMADVLWRLGYRRLGE